MSLKMIVCFQIQLIVFAVTSIPILFTDPWTQALV